MYRTKLFFEPPEFVMHVREGGPSSEACEMHDRGTVLVEQLIALALLSLLVVSIFSLLTTGTLAAHLARESGLAGGFAAQKLEEILASPEEPADVSRQPLDPQRFPRYDWQVTVTDADPGLRQVTVTVWWPLRTTERSISLTTLIGRQDE